MYLDTKNKKDCSGCTACMASCPVQCISMKKDKDGFLYPEIDEDKCIKCGKCRKICPFRKKDKISDKEKKVFYAIHKDESVRLSSTSGGAFTGIVQSFEPDVVYGVKYDEENRVVYDVSIGKEKIGKFKKSKYVQATLNDTFLKVKEDLKNNKKVLFTGTPCYVSGLKSFLNKDYDNLLLVDLVCHGVTSPKVFAKFIELEENKKKSKLKRFVFRNKISKMGKWDYNYTTMEYENGKNVSSRFNSFAYGFSRGLFHRKSCFNCPFISLNRSSDLTIGDFWGIENEKKIIDDKKGTSIILPNTQKGDMIISSITKYMNIGETSIKNVIQKNPHLATRPIEFNNKRDNFFTDLDEVGFEKAFKRNTSHIWRIKRFFLIYLPVPIKKLIKKCFIGVN